MPKNFFAVRTDKDIEIYLNEFDLIAQEYIERLDKPDDIEKYNVFTGLIVEIADRCRFDKDLKTYEDIDFLWKIWKQYRNLVYRFNFNPKLEEFAVLLNIHRDTLYSWMNGETRKEDYSQELSVARSDTIRKMQSECALGRYKSAEHNNIGGIFLCKSVDGLRETAPLTAAEIQEQKLGANQLPTLGAVNGAKLARLTED